MNEMKKCSYFDRDDIGIRYATWTDSGLFERDESQLSHEQTKLKKQFLDFEKHYFQCRECSEQLRDYQAFRFGVEKLGEQDQLPLQVSTGNLFMPRLLAYAASIFFVMTVALLIWVIMLKKDMKELSGLRSPETISQLYVLKSPAPLHRAGNMGEVRIPEEQDSFLLAVVVPREKIDDNRFHVKIVDTMGSLIWIHDDVPVDPDGRIYIQLRQGILTPGTYTLEVTMVNRKDLQKSAIGKYPFIIE
jgi:hypothetical protein